MVNTQVTPRKRVRRNQHNPQTHTDTDTDLNRATRYYGDYVNGNDDCASRLASPKIVSFFFVKKLFSRWVAERVIIGSSNGKW